MAHRERIESLWRALPGRGAPARAHLRLAHPAPGASTGPQGVGRDRAAALGAGRGARRAREEPRGRGRRSRPTWRSTRRPRADARRVAAKAPKRSGRADRYLDRINQLLAETSRRSRSTATCSRSAIYAEKGDITEELARLDGHLTIRQVLRPRPKPAEAEFLLQEMLREANTIGSKSLDLAISHQVVEIKAEIEKMKEQVQNLE
jgi:hypothetical protein